MPAVRVQFAVGAVALAVLGGCPPPGEVRVDPPTPPPAPTCPNPCVEQQKRLNAATRRVNGMTTVTCFKTGNKNVGDKGAERDCEIVEPVNDPAYQAAVQQRDAALVDLLACRTTNALDTTVTLDCSGQATLETSDANVGTQSGALHCSVAFGPPCHQDVKVRCDPANLPAPGRQDGPAGIVVYIGPIQVDFQQRDFGYFLDNRTIDVRGVLTTTTHWGTDPNNLSGTDTEKLPLYFGSDAVPAGSSRIHLRSTTTKFVGGQLNDKTGVMDILMQCNAPLPDR